MTSAHRIDLSRDTRYDIFSVQEKELLAEVFSHNPMLPQLFNRYLSVPVTRRWNEVRADIDAMNCAPIASSAGVDTKPMLDHLSVYSESTLGELSSTVSDNLGISGVNRKRLLSQKVKQKMQEMAEVSEAAELATRALEHKYVISTEDLSQLKGIAIKLMAYGDPEARKKNSLFEEFDQQRTTLSHAVWDVRLLQMVNLALLGDAVNAGPVAPDSSPKLPVNINLFEQAVVTASHHIKTKLGKDLLADMVLKAAPNIRGHQRVVHDSIHGTTSGGWAERSVKKPDPKAYPGP